MILIQAHLHNINAMQQLILDNCKSFKRSTYCMLPHLKLQVAAVNPPVLRCRKTPTFCSQQKIPGMYEEDLSIFLHIRKNKHNV